MTQLLELKATKPTEISPLATAFGVDSPPTPAIEEAKVEPQWDAPKKGAKLEVTAFDGSLDPKRYMDWEVGLDEYFDLVSTPGGLPDPICSDETQRAGPDLLAKFTGHHGASSRPNDHNLGGYKKPPTGEVHSRLLPAYDH